jgi:hypothetical protein
MSYRQTQGQADSPDRPDRVAPVVEKYAGTNMPWRGTETHGVDVPADTVYDTLEAQRPWVDDDADIQYMAPEEEPEPIPVKVVNETARERLAWRATRYRVTDSADMILGRHEKRRNVRIKVHFQTDGVDSNPIWIGGDDTVKPYTGYQMDRGEILFPFVSSEAVYAICNPGEQVEVSIMYDYAVEL